MQLHASNEPYFQSLRDLLDYLERIGKLQRIAKTVDKDWEIACITRQVMYQAPERRYAMLFESVTGRNMTAAVGRLSMRFSQSSWPSERITIPTHACA